MPHLHPLLLWCGAGCVVSVIAQGQPAHCTHHLHTQETECWGKIQRGRGDFCCIRRLCAWVITYWAYGQQANVCLHEEAGLKCVWVCAVCVGVSVCVCVLCVNLSPYTPPCDIFLSLSHWRWIRVIPFSYFFLFSPFPIRPFLLLLSYAPAFNPSHSYMSFSLAFSSFPGLPFLPFILTFLSFHTCL